MSCILHHRWSAARSGWIRGSAGLALFCLAGLAPAQQPGQLSAPSGDVLRLGPGEQGELYLRAVGTQPMAVELRILAGSGAEYEALPMATAGCPSLQPLTRRWLSFDPTLAGGDLYCRYTIRRLRRSRNDLQLGLFPPVSQGPGVIGLQLNFGVAPQFNFSARQLGAELLPDGRARSTVELKLRSDAAVALDGLHAGLCLDNEFPSVDFDGSMPGGCGALGDAMTCFFRGMSFALPQLPAQGQAVCRLQLTSREPYIQPLSTYFNLDAQSVRNLDTGGYVALPRYTPGVVLPLVLDALFSSNFE